MFGLEHVYTRCIAFYYYLMKNSDAIVMTSFGNAHCTRFFSVVAAADEDNVELVALARYLYT